MKIRTFLLFGCFLQGFAQDTLEANYSGSAVSSHHHGLGDVLSVVRAACIPSVVLGSIVGTVAATAPGLRLAIISEACEGGDDADLPFVLHPTRLAVFGSNAAGAVIGNLILIVSALLLLCILKIVLPGVLMRFPVLHSIPVLCAQGLLYGVVYSAALLVFRSGSVAAVFGAVVFAAGVLVPLAGLMRIVSNVADGAAHYTLDVDTEERTFLTFFIGNGEWVSGSSSAVWLDRMSAVVRDNKPDWLCFYYVDIAGSTALAAVQATLPETSVGCASQKLFLTSILIALSVAEIWISPRSQKVVTYAMVATNGMQAMASLFMAFGFLGWSGFQLSEVFLIISIVVILLKSSLEVYCTFYIVQSSRRDRLQGDAFLSTSVSRKPSGAGLDSESISLPAYNTHFARVGSGPFTPLHGTPSGGGALGGARYSPPSAGHLSQDYSNSCIAFTPPTPHTDMLRVAAAAEELVVRPLPSGGGGGRGGGGGGGGGGDSGSEDEGGEVPALLGTTTVFRVSNVSLLSSSSKMSLL